MAIAQVLYRHVPRDLIERPKTGFSIPLGEWLRGPLREWAETLLSEKRLRDGGLLSVQDVRRTWARAPQRQAQLAIFALGRANA